MNNAGNDQASTTQAGTDWRALLPGELSTIQLDSPEPGVVVLTLDRPRRLNALSLDLLGELHAVLDALALAPSIRVLILTGAGRGFCAGLDLVDHDTGGTRRTPQDGLALQKIVAGLVPKLRALPQVVIAAVNGPAAGGGLALALACDVRIAATSARFNVAFIRIGVSGCDVPGTPRPQLLRHLTGQLRVRRPLTRGADVMSTIAHSPATGRDTCSPEPIS